jgi:hypothetical protein
MAEDKAGGKVRRERTQNGVRGRRDKGHETVDAGKGTRDGQWRGKDEGQGTRDRREGKF